MLWKLKSIIFMLPTSTCRWFCVRACFKICDCLSFQHDQQLVKQSCDSFYNPTRSIIVLYPTSSNPGRFYGIAKLHKLLPNGTIEDLPIRPIASNIGTASYRLAKYLTQNLSPLGQSTYSIIKHTNFTFNKIIDHTYFFSFKWWPSAKCVTKILLLSIQAKLF